MSTAGPHKISCEEFLDRLNDFVDCEVGEDLRRQLEEHSSRCRHCEVTYDDVRRTVNVFGEEYALCPEPAPTGVMDRLWSALPCARDKK